MTKKKESQQTQDMGTGSVKKLMVRMAVPALVGQVASPLRLQQEGVIVMTKKKESQQTQDMGTGSVKKLMVRMAVPALVGQVINLLYNIVDRIYIGHIPDIGGTALTGVGLFTPILMLVTAFAMLAGAGGAPRAAIAMGRGQKDEAEQIVGNCFTVLMILAVVLTAVFYVTLSPLIRLFGGSDSTLPYALEYGRIYILGSVFVLIVMGMNTFITTQGFAKTSMLTTVIGAVINIVLDPIFIFVLDMGVTGAALATVLSQAVSAIWILKFLMGKKTILRLKAKNLRLVPKIITPCLSLGVSSFIMISTESILSISFTSSLARFGGDVAVGAMTVLTSINQLVTMPLTGICQGGQPLISFNYGARKLDRVKEAFFCQFFVCIAYTTGFWLLLMFFPSFFAGIFTLRCQKAGPGEGSLLLPVFCVHRLHHRLLAAADVLPQLLRRYFHQRYGPGGLHRLGTADFPGRRFLHRLPNQLPAGFHGPGPGENQPVYGLPA